MPQINTAFAIQSLLFVIIILVVFTALLVIAASLDLQLLLALFVGLLAGAALSILFGLALSAFAQFSLLTALPAVIIICFITVTVTLNRRKDLFPWLSTSKEKEDEFKKEHASNLLIDDAALFDGRITNLLRSGFFERKIELTTATIQALYTLANDEANVENQERGKRALECIAVLKNEFSAFLIFTDEKATDPKLPVAQQLFEIAQRRSIGVLTCDHSIEIAAKQKGIPVLNILELSDALKPVYFTNQKLQVKLLQIGKNPNEAIGILHDGSKVIVADGSIYIGQEITAIVDGTLETVAGRIVQAHPEHSA
ncbi:MAG: hypothetical protein WCP97_06050 [bacterium]